MPFSTGNTGVVVREPRVIVASPFRKAPEATKVTDGTVTDKAGNRYEIGVCGHWAPDGTCRHGCKP